MQDDEEHQKKADHISGTVLNLLDKNRDGKVSPEEFEQVGLDGLPNFESLGAEGHHYDVESEFFLHHEGAQEPHAHSHLQSHLGPQRNFTPHQRPKRTSLTITPKTSSTSHITRK